jgi:branched-chain amino acid transport system ATP-binding protein
MLLDVKDLKVHYGKAEALKNISISIEDGSIVTLIGANGAGKTTTLKTISGLLTPTSGEILFQNDRIDGMPSHRIVKKGIAHVPEGRMVFAPMTVLENLQIGAHLRDDKTDVQKDFDRMYEHFPILKSRRGQRSGSLSGGEQQMLAIARALMVRPKLILMDEPSMGLSPILVEEIGQIITNINQIGVSILLVEQNARMALKLANKVYILEVGRIALEGDPEKISADEGIKRAYLGG